MAADPHLTAAISRHIWDTKYRFRKDGYAEAGIEDSWRRVAHALAGAEDAAGREHWAERFYHALAAFRFVPGGRIQAGAGTGRRVTLFNCFVMGTVEDSMDGIFDGLKEGAMTLQQGGGVGYDFSTLRPAGSAAHAAGTVASGPVSFMRIWDAMCATLLSTGARRGAMMATLRCDHPDIEQFIAAKQDGRSLRHFNLSVLASDEFMRAVREDADWPLVFPQDALGGAGSCDTVLRVWSGAAMPVRCRVMKRVRARELWDAIMRATYDYAEPGVLFIDRINRENNLYYREQISATNPCVTADTWVHTSEGPRQVFELVGRQFTGIINGEAHPSMPAGFFRTGRKPVFTLRAREGYQLRLTGNHPVLRAVRVSSYVLETEWTLVDDLRPGDQLILQNHRRSPAWPGIGDEGEGYLLGLLVGDGVFAEGAAELRAWPQTAIVNGESERWGVYDVMKAVEDIVAGFPRRSDFSGWRYGSSGQYRFLKMAHLTRAAARFGITHGNKTITPQVEQGSSDFCRGFLRGLFDSDGSVQGSQQKGVSIRLSQSDEALLQSAQRMLLRLGIVSTIYSNRRPEGSRMLPDGTGGRRSYMCRANHELVIAGDNMLVFSDLVGFVDGQKHQRLNGALTSYKQELNRERFAVTVESIESTGVEDVYDVQMPGVNAFDANGLQVHNCGEIPLPPYGACDLGSINLTSFVKKPFEADAELDMGAIKELVPVAVRMLDDVVDVSRFPLDRQARQAQGTRRVGLGITGLADALIMLGMVYGSPESRDLAARVMRTICHAAYRSSVELAREKGPFPFFERDPHLAAPFIASLPDDIRAGIARHGIRNSHLTAIAPTGTISLLANNVSSSLEPVFDFSYRRRVLELDGSHTEYELRDYARVLWDRLHPGAPLPPAFVNAHGLPPGAHLDMQAAVQPYVDNAISKTVNIPEDYDYESFKDVYLRAYELGLKGCTTFRPNRVTGEILSTGGEGFERALHCCDLERETD